MTKIVAIDVLTEDLAIAILATDGGGPIAVNDQGREFFVIEDSPDPEPGSPMTEY